MVVNTIIPVVAATVLWKYSIINSFIGTRPAGQRGQSGQLSPTPEELTYPPIKISVKTMNKVEKASLVRNILVYYATYLQSLSCRYLN